MKASKSLIIKSLGKNNLEEIGVIVLLEIAKALNHKRLKIDSTEFEPFLMRQIYLAVKKHLLILQRPKRANLKGRKK